MIRLRFAIDVEFDSVDTAKAYGVALGWALGTISENALATSESPAPTVKREKMAVAELTADQAHG